MFHSFCMTCVDENGLLRWWRFWQDFESRTLTIWKRRHREFRRSFARSWMEWKQLLLSTFSDSIPDGFAPFLSAIWMQTTAYFDWLSVRSQRDFSTHAQSTSVGQTQQDRMGGNGRLTLSGFSDTNEFRRIRITTSVDQINKNKKDKAFRSLPAEMWATFVKLFVCRRVGFFYEIYKMMKQKKRKKVSECESK